MVSISSGLLSDAKRLLEKTTIDRRLDRNKNNIRSTEKTQDIKTSAKRLREGKRKKYKQ
jgi:hypothetical protein